jgi:hypothetical protein
MRPLTTHLLAVGTLIATLGASAANRDPNADLSTVSTGRGVRIGSAYEELLAIYGGKPVKKTARLVVRYVASVPDESLAKPHMRVSDDEVLTFVIDQDEFPP